MADKCPPCEEGLPAYLATFADLMSLLMCFFVLLLSFATIDAIRFKKMAESMKDAFGVQREIPAAEIVKGVSVIKQEWSPSVSEQSVINEVRQETSDVEKENLKMNDGEMDAEQAMKLADQIIEKELQGQMAELQEALKEQIDQGLISLDKEEKKIIIRIQEKGSFGSGSARLDPGFYKVIDRISEVLATRPGKILVAGHTDNIPIRTGRFRSNWELSSVRAVTVLHALLRNPRLDQRRVVVQGFADTRPVADNDTPQGRAKNRRVELIILRGRDHENGEKITIPTD
ncbi:type VI secretion system protein TssL, long form [endosymbiont of unidentified scaly snail isolate Monju]|uniref:type VI secretion system protein TssL, long form n=1 Tax=endosymbiont of unidentified scaly snail isolate Monju TaxID=1248727 RepID=UPI0003892BA3|nr:type VI secretion system protein TssL, long form [endosymbiont of unidentified scaly snail isolate Monju]BAN69554.1 flagellar motor protein MotB [endosymbiont of unidentified scaly snail isolate Monju]